VFLQRKITQRNGSDSEQAPAVLACGGLMQFDTIHPHNKVDLKTTNNNAVANSYYIYFSYEVQR
jgi:hypothetical protein